jgi:hypothetical protein
VLEFLLTTTALIVGIVIEACFGHIARNVKLACKSSHKFKYSSHMNVAMHTYGVALNSLNA